MKPMKPEELRELDAWIATDVMKWRWKDFETSHPFGGCWVMNNGAGGMEGSCVFSFTPTTDPAAAMLVLEKCAERCVVTVENDGKQWMVARLSQIGDDYVEDFCKCDQTLPMAICRFAEQLFARTLFEKGMK